VPPSTPSSGHPSARDRNRRLRIRAGELFAAGSSQAEVARLLGVTRQTASRWHKTWAAGGTEALVAASRRGRPGRLSDADLARIGDALRQGPAAHVFQDGRWTCRQVALVIHRLTGVSYHPAHVCRLIHRMGWRVRPPY
jgi:transposase